MPVAYESSKLKSWASDVDVNTLLQAEKCARLPFVYDHVALMPDAHVGKGATVGSVIPTEGAIIPAAVGVDIGCVDRDSEYLSPTGWRKISEYRSDDQIMMYVPGTGQGIFTKPTEYVVRPETTFYRLKTKYGIDQMLSADHRVLCWKIVGRDRQRVMTVVSAQDFAAKHMNLVQGFKAEFATTFAVDNDTKVDLSDDAIRVQVMINADGHIEPSGIVRLAFKKSRKIKRARELLRNAGIPWSERISTDRVTTLTLHHRPVQSKSYDLFWGSSGAQLAVIAEECLYWDGNSDSNCVYTRDKESADFIQYAFTATGRRAVIRADKHYRDGKLDYRVFASSNVMVGMAGTPRTDIDTVSSPDGKSYCFRVPTGFWVMRRGGNVVITGNCGMIATLTDLTADALPDSLAPLMTLVESRIPAGVGQSHDSYTRRVMATVGSPRSELTSRQEDTMWRQLGTLGSGNHFVEVCLDETDRVWAVLHSGSRGIGNQLAFKHIKIAQAFHQDVEDKDLAYFLQGTPEFEVYIADMLWAQGYAFGNRAKMAEALNQSLFEACGKGIVIDQINCHHNFTEQEEFDGKRLWITRKGAIKAYQGDRGVIPGSMGTASYIVRGRGVRDSWFSCSHGAGRRMSRSQAKRELTPESLTEAMGTRTWNNDPQALLDEHPDSYKDIDQVMADQSDLVTVEAVLHSVLNYKGTK